MVMVVVFCLHVTTSCTGRGREDREGRERSNKLSRETAVLVQEKVVPGSSRRGASPHPRSILAPSLILILTHTLFRVFYRRLGFLRCYAHTPSLSLPLFSFLFECQLLTTSLSTFLRVASRQSSIAHCVPLFKKKVKKKQLCSEQRQREEGCRCVCVRCGVVKDESVADLRSVKMGKNPSSLLRYVQHVFVAYLFLFVGVHRGLFFFLWIFELLTAAISAVPLSLSPTGPFLVPLLRYLLSGLSFASFTASGFFVFLSA
jgi:hypothetical protein